MHRNSKRGVGLVVLVASVTGITSYGCLPEPDTSGLPARDAGADTTYIPPTPTGDAGHDANVPSSDAGEAGPTEAASTVGTIAGLVLNYSEGGARGVLPGAKVAIAGTSISTVTDARGAFVLPNVTAGKVVLNVSHPTDKGAGIAYGTTQIAVPLLGGQTVDVFPVVHTGCTVTFTPTVDATSGLTKAIQAGCASRSGVYASFHIDDAASLRLGTAIYASAARIEFIPLAFPSSSPTDLSWSIGMPGDLTAQGGAIDPVGGAEIRVVVDSSDPNQDGAQLELFGTSRALLQIPVFRQPSSGEALALWTYDTTKSQWVVDATATQALFGTASAYDPQLDTTFSFDVLNVSVDHLSWWSVAKLRTDTGCVAGTLVAGGVPAAGVLVRGVGVESLGASANVTDTNGKFCLDGVADGSITLLGGYAPTAGRLFTTSAGPSALSSTGHTCAAGPSQCKQIGTVTMTAVDPSCVIGRVLSNLGDTPIATKLDLRVQVPAIGSNQVRAGVNGFAYVGQVQPGSDGTACVPSTAGGTYSLQDSTGTACGNSSGQGATINVPSTAGAGACGGGSCADGGTFRYYCAAP